MFFFGTNSIKFQHGMDWTEFWSGPAEFWSGPAELWLRLTWSNSTKF